VTWLGDRPGNLWTAAPGAPRGELATSDEDVGRIFQWRVVRRLLAYVVPHKKHASLGVGAMLCLQVLQLLQPLVEGLAIDRVVAGDREGLVLLGGIYLATMFGNWLAQYQQVYQMTWVGQQVLFQLAQDMFDHIVRLSLSFFDRNETGRIMSRMQSDVNVLQQILSSGLISTLGSLIAVVGVVVTMFILNWRLALISTSVIPVFVLIMAIWQGYARRSFRRARATISEVSANLEENVSGVRVVQGLGREEQNYGAFQRANLANLRANVAATGASAFTQPLVEIMSGVALALIIAFGGSMVLNDTLSIGLLYAFSRYVIRFFEPVRLLTQEYSQLQRAAVAAERIFEILDTEEEVKEAPDAIVLPPIQGRVTYDRVNFSYVPGVEILRDFSLEVAPGERIAIVGPTGAGKSTLANLLLRFYDVSGGRILVDGHDIRDVTLSSLRRQIGIVLQDPILFNGTIRDNIRYSRPEAADAEVVAAAAAVGVDEMIRRQELGYDTPVRERGVGLSMGERQLICFARALLSDPKILILDEATANLDTRSEAIIQHGIGRLTEGRTSLIIAHRLSTIRDADRIVVLENGTISEMGTHASLISRGGLYYRLYAMGQQQLVAGNGTSVKAT
jgi:ATP-binding cassette subfamily B protein